MLSVSRPTEGSGGSKYGQNTRMLFLLPCGGSSGELKAGLVTILRGAYLACRCASHESLSHQMCRPVCGPSLPFPAYTLQVLRIRNRMT